MMGHFRRGLVGDLTGRAMLAVLAAAVSFAAAPARADPQALLALQRYDQLLGGIGYRLAASAGDLCRDPVRLPGFAVHDLSQYARGDQRDAIAAFGFDGAPLVLAVAPASPADDAGLAPGDALIAIEGTPVPPAVRGARNSYARVAAVLTRIDAALTDGVLDLALRRRGRDVTVRIAAQSGCASRFQTRVSDSIDSQADGTYVEINTGVITFAGADDQVAAVVAHELAHNILRHRERLNAMGIRRGLLGQFGRSARLVRQTEEEADRLSVHLMDRAGYPAGAGIAFWRRYRSRNILGFLAAPTHLSETDRIAVIEEEMARIAAMKADGLVPRPLFMEGESLPELR